MGMTYATLKIRNFLTESNAIAVEAKVDTGALTLVLTGSIADRFDFPTIRKQTVRYANKRRETNDIVAGVEVEVCGRVGVFEAIVEPRKSDALLGAIVMETLDLIVEPRSLQLYPNPRSPDLPMTEVE